MSDNVDKNEIRKAIDRLQLEHPVSFAFDATKIAEPSMAKTVQDDIDRVAQMMAKDASIHIICEFAKLYLDGVKPTADRPHGEWIDTRNFPVRWTCSECGRRDTHIYNFCPDCGAKMR